MFRSFTIRIIIFAITILISNSLAQSIDNNSTESDTTCRAEQKLPSQPELLNFPPVRKCCTEDENLYMSNSTIQNYYGCGRAIYPVFVNFSIVEVYADCLLFRNRNGGEIALENGDKLPGFEFFPCLYYGDFYGSHIIQNGSLLVTNTYGTFNYRIHNNFCLDADAHSGMYMVCHDIEESATILDTDGPKIGERNTFRRFFTIVSIPSLICIVLSYCFVKDFRTIHGICIISLCCFMTIEYILRSVLDSSSSGESQSLRHTIQYFDLVHHFWLLVLFVNTMLFVWIYLPFKLFEWRYFGIYSYAGFFISCLAIPSVASNQLQDDDIRTFLDFFTTPKTTISLMCIMLLIIVFMGSNRLATSIKKEILEKYYSDTAAENDNDIIRHHQCFEEIQNRLTCLTSVAGMMVITRVFYIPGHKYLMIVRELLTSFQGIFLLLIFVGLRYKEIQQFLVRRFKK